jgi:hypothetical protein
VHLHTILHHAGNPNALITVNLNVYTNRKIFFNFSLEQYTMYIGNMQ